MLSLGDTAPDFEFTDANGPTSLRACLAGGPVVLYFYPADFTPVCTKEACMFRDLHGDLVSRGVRVLGVSPQSEESHQQFRAKHTLPFTLISDPDRRIIRAYRAGGMFGLPLPFGTRRITYFIATDGKIADIATGEFGLGAHARFAARAMEWRDPHASDPGDSRVG